MYKTALMALGDGWSWETIDDEAADHSWDLRGRDHGLWQGDCSSWLLNED